MGRVAEQGRVVAITGARTFLGSELIKRLEEDRRYERVIALDIRKPELPLDKTEYMSLDLTEPTVGAELSRLIQSERVDTLVHGAFLSYPTHASAWAHELEDIGTMHVVNACQEARPARLVMISTTMVYGASPGNPNFLDETAELRGHVDSRYVSDKVRAERQVARFAQDNPQTRVAVLRFAPVLGPTVLNLFTRYFARPIAPVMMGYDPLVQFIHESDAVRALDLALAKDIAGPLNIVGRGVLPYTTVLALMGRLPLPLPHFAARALNRVLWATQIADSPPAFLDFLRYICVADGSRAEAALGFTARFDIKRTIIDFLSIGAEDGAPDIARAQG